MFRIIAALTLVAALAHPVRAQDAAAADPIRSVIRQQLDAFLADDFATAFTFASPGIRQLFGDPDNFGVMVRRGYPMVWRPAETRFLDLEARDGRTLQTVLIRDANGVPHLLEYSMSATGDGWKIDGVRILRPPEVGA